MDMVHASVLDKLILPDGLEIAQAQAEARLDLALKVFLAGVARQGGIV